MQFNLGFIPMEDDLLSLEMEEVARDIYLVSPLFLMEYLMLIMNQEWGRYSHILLVFSPNDISARLWCFSANFGQRRRCEGICYRAFTMEDTADHLPQKLADLLQRHRTSGPSQYSEIEPAEKVDGLIIIDRSVDWVTPMCTQLTYEGMLDEFMGIKNCTSELHNATSSL